MSSDTEYEPPSDVDSYASVEMEIQELSHVISELYSAAEELEMRLTSLHPPLENTQISQLGQLAFVQASPFRSATFAVKPPGFPGVDLSRRYAFQEICGLLRSYLIHEKLVNTDNSVQINDTLRTLLGIEESVKSLGYVSLLGHLRHLLV